MRRVHARLVVLALALVAGIVVALRFLREPTPYLGARSLLPVAGKLVLNGVTVVDVRTGQIAPGRSILSDAGRIVRVAPAGTLPAEPSAQAIDATGTFVVPGYFDMHAHALGLADPSGALALMLAEGITGFRQMQGSAELLERRRAGTFAMPDDSPALLAMPGQILSPFNAGSPEDAVATVREQEAAGADFIKIGLISPEVLFAVLAEARRIGIPAVGHVPANVDVVAASRAGMRSIEHLGPSPGILVACSAEAPALAEAAPRMPRFLKAPPFPLPFADEIVSFLLEKRIVNPVVGTGPAELDRLRRILETQNEESCRHAASELVANGTWVVPTLVRLRTSRLASAPEYQADPNLRYVPPDTVETWREVTQTYSEEFSPDAQETLGRVYALDLKLVKLLDSAGVPMLAGSDVVGAGWLVPGFSLHQEFDELEKAGLSPLRVLQMTTLDGAEFLGRTSTLGSVEPGKDADLVLLEANPLESVQNLHRIHGVVRAGFYRSRDDLEALKSRVASEAAR